MPTAARRLSRRALAALVAAVTAASLLAPAGASAAVNETSAERFGGEDRYETSVAIAEAYLAEIADNPDRASIRAAIVVSGEDRHAVYGMPAAGLASAFDAPILLTPADRLHDSVRSFIEVNDIELVLLIGGPSVVSLAVESELADCAGSVRRLWGSDVYASSVAVAAAVGPIPGSAGEWGSRGRTALLANGVGVADALVAGPLSYHGSHPLLLTPAAALDEQVSEYLDRSDVEHVVIFGGTAAVSSAVESAVKAKGITTSRLAGDDRYETAAVVARRLLGSARPDRCFDGSVIGLAVGERPPDAVASGPLLGERCAPLLLTRSRAVPTQLDDVLTGGDLLGGPTSRLEVVVFGGAAAVAESTVWAVRNRALRGAPFTAEVSAVGGSKVFTVTFNEDVKEDEAIKAERYTVNNQPLALEDDAAAPESARRYTQISLAGRTVTVELVEPLAVGNTITVLGETGTEEGRTQIAVDDTLPALESVFYRVPRPPAVTDSVGPQIQIVAIAGDSEFVVLVTERALRPGDRLRNDVERRGQEVHELTVVDKEGEPKDVIFVASSTSCPHKSESDAPLGDKIGERCYEDPATLGANFRYTAMLADEGATLEAGDVVTVARGTLYDQRRNPNKLTRYTVRAHADNADHGDFTVQRAAVGKPRHTRQATLLIQNNTCGTSGDAACEGSRRVRITARSTSVAAGAAGNGWIVYPYVDPDRAEPADSVIEVGVDPVHRVISYTIADGKITLANLSAALNADAEFKRHFSSRVVTSSSTTGVVGIADPAGGSLIGGMSTVGVRVQFSDHVRSVPAAPGADTAPDARYASLFGSAGAAPAGFKAPLTFASIFLGDSDADDDRVAVRCQRRGDVVYLEYRATDAALAPRAGTPVSVPIGVAAGHGDQNEDGTPDVQNLR
ncbi:MAG: cell wall-binding repeat-containing protein [Acidimicrobiaceae bacterium]|nr:cell wall-binding repeat-containing protein [Acidimicrobiaceae bacterium]